MGRAGQTYTISFPTKTAKKRFLDLLNSVKATIEKKHGLKKSVPEVLLEALEMLERKIKDDKV